MQDVYCGDTHETCCLGSMDTRLMGYGWTVSSFSAGFGPSTERTKVERGDKEGKGEGRRRWTILVFTTLSRGYNSMDDILGAFDVRSNHGGMGTCSKVGVLRVTGSCLNGLAPSLAGYTCIRMHRANRIECVSAIAEKMT